MKERNLDWLFEVEPSFYGLRGSLELWEEMREKCKLIPGDKSVEELKEYFYTLFQELTSYPLCDGEVIYVKKYDLGHGMSAGLISRYYWVNVAIPLLLKRFSEGVSPFSSEEIFMKEMRSALPQESYPSQKGKTP